MNTIDHMFQVSRLLYLTLSAGAVYFYSFATGRLVDSFIKFVMLSEVQPHNKAVCWEFRPVIICWVKGLASAQLVILCTQRPADLCSCPRCK